MSRKNISKLFFKDYFEERNGFNFSHVISGNTPDKDTQKEVLNRNRAIKEVELKEIPALPFLDKNEDCFSLIIAYPGLVTGTGLVHDSKKLEGGYNLGMHFDYTWGMPIVYGSSVKGVLRSYFKEFYNGNIDKDDLFEDIFNGRVRNKEKDKKNNKGELEKRGYDNKSIYQRDIFFDAVIIKDYKGHILEDDSITPHGDNPLKNPIPITMLKIAPGCTLEFRFRLKDSHINGVTYGKEEKLKLFKTILETVGVGAKTNVGYGQFVNKFSTIS